MEFVTLFCLLVFLFSDDTDGFKFEDDFRSGDNELRPYGCIVWRRLPKTVLSLFKPLRPLGLFSDAIIYQLCNGSLWVTYIPGPSLFSKSPLSLVAGIFGGANGEETGLLDCLSYIG